VSSFELDPDEMQKARNELESQLAALEKHRGQAEILAQPLQDGNNLVARQMRKAYLDRADTDNGVRAVLDDYINELRIVIASINATLDTYGAMDTDGAAIVARSQQGQSGQVN
jgi:hypothetical protein